MKPDSRREGWGRVRKAIKGKTGPLLIYAERRKLPESPVTSEHFAVKLEIKLFRESHLMASAASMLASDTDTRDLCDLVQSSPERPSIRHRGPTRLVTTPEIRYPPVLTARSLRE